MSGHYQYLLRLQLLSRDDVVPEISTFEKSSGKDCFVALHSIKTRAHLAGLISAHFQRSQSMSSIWW